MWPLISGQNATSPRTDIPITYESLISGDYKILTGNVHEAGWSGPVFPNNTNRRITTEEECGDSGCLYNIRKDPLEYVNLAKTMPDMLRTMKAKLMKYQATHFEPDRGDEWPGACDTAINKYNGFWGPFL